jgi:hypothetical protein
MNERQTKIINDKLYFFDGSNWREAKKSTCIKCGIFWYIRKDREAKNGLCQRCHVIGDKNPMYGKVPHNKGTGLGNKECLRRKHAIRKRWCFDYKGGKCSVCGVSNLPLPCYHFHHIKKRKRTFNNILVCKNWKNMAIEELEKCIMVCANCHITLHFGK